jgi:hypothetical protein
MAEVTEKEKSRQALTNRDSTQQTNKNATMGILSTTAGAIVMLLGFTAIPDHTLQLAVVSLGGWMIGGAR